MKHSCIDKTHFDTWLKYVSRRFEFYWFHNTFIGSHIYFFFRKELIRTIKLFVSTKCIFMVGYILKEDIKKTSNDFLVIIYVKNENVV